MISATMIAWATLTVLTGLVHVINDVQNEQEGQHAQADDAASGSPICVALGANRVKAAIVSQHPSGSLEGLSGA